MTQISTRGTSVTFVYCLLKCLFFTGALQLHLVNVLNNNHIYMVPLHLQMILVPVGTNTSLDPGAPSTYAGDH